MIDGRKSGIREIAGLAGVSTATVSRVLNGKGNVDPEITERVMRIAGEVGYEPSPAARYMRSKRSDLLGIVVPKLSMSYFSDIVNGAIDKAGELGRLMVVATVEGSEGTEKEYLKKLSQHMLDGLIYCPVATGEYVETENFTDKMPLVVAGRRRVVEGAPHVSTDDEKAGYIATKYLLQLRRRSIGFFAGFWGRAPFTNTVEMINGIDSSLSGSFSTLDRLRGYRRALREFGLDVDAVKIVITGFDAEEGYLAAEEFFARLDMPDAVIVPNSYVAKGLIRFCSEQGIQIPKDLSLVSMDDLTIGELLPIPVTSIIHNMYMVGVESVVRIDRLLNGLETQDKLIDVRLKIRQSTEQKAI